MRSVLQGWGLGFGVQGLGLMVAGSICSLRSVGNQLKNLRGTASPVYPGNMSISRCRPKSSIQFRFQDVPCSLSRGLKLPDLQGYLSHKKTAPPWDPTVGICLVPYGSPKGGAVYYERGTPVRTIVSPPRETVAHPPTPRSTLKPTP